MRTRNAEKERLVKQKAIESIVKDGFEGFSMNKLAKLCDISVATLYIYYKDRDDLIISIAAEVGAIMGEAMIKNLRPDMLFEEGLKIQWQNRYNYVMRNTTLFLFTEQVRLSTYHEYFLKPFVETMEKVLGEFLQNVHKRGEIEEMPFEVYWSVAFAPLYSLLRFHHERQSLGGRPFKISDEMLWQAFDLVIKALKK